MKPLGKKLSHMDENCNLLEMTVIGQGLYAIKKTGFMTPLLVQPDSSDTVLKKTVIPNVYEYYFQLTPEEYQSILEPKDLVYVYEFASKRNEGYVFIKCMIDVNLVIDNLTYYLNNVRTFKSDSTVICVKQDKVEFGRNGIVIDPLSISEIRDAHDVIRMNTASCVPNHL